MSLPESDARDYRWLEGWVLDEEKLGGVIGLTVASIDSPDGFLELVGAQPPFQTARGVPALSKESLPGCGLVGVTQALDKDGRAIEGLVLGAECPGITSYDSAARLSGRGGEVLAFHYNLGQDWLKWAVDGVVQAEFSLPAQRGTYDVQQCVRRGGRRPGRRCGMHGAAVARERPESPVPRSCRPSQWHSSAQGWICST